MQQCRGGRFDDGAIQQAGENTQLAHRHCGQAPGLTLFVASAHSWASLVRSCFIAMAPFHVVSSGVSPKAVAAVLGHLFIGRPARPESA